MMKTVLILASVLTLAHHAFAQTCSSIPQYSETFVPDCAGNDVFVLWPKYDNFTQYYRCQGAGNPVIANCPLNEYFSYYLQICTLCPDFIPPPDCTYLKTQNKPKCVAINTTTEKPTTTTTTKGPVTTSTKKPAITTPTTEASVTTTTVSGVPQPPSPSTVDPKVPTPPTPAPTPPTVAPNPPSEAPPA